MKIVSSTIGMESARSYTSVKYSRVRNGAGRTGANENGKNLFQNLLAGGDEATSESYGANVADKRQQQMKDIADQFRTLSNSGKVNSTEESTKTKDPERAITEIRQQCIISLLYFLFNFSVEHGNKMSPTLQNMMDEYGISSSLPTTNMGIGASNFMGTSEQVTGLGPYTVTTELFYGEAEETNFTTAGKVVTSDGREIDFNMDISMSRTAVQYAKTTHAFTDPLVINFDTDMTEIEDQHFFFDLNGDGKNESIAQLSSGSGYLALDLDENGTIDDGSELFGTKSGDGFFDLSKYDEDQNGWIDENDSIFDKLKIWTKDENGTDQLYTLKEKGVGALCLNHVATDFTLTDSTQTREEAKIRSTGFFLYENGMTGTMQHVDMAM